MNQLQNLLPQANLVFSDNDAGAVAGANSGGNIAMGLLALNAGNPALAVANAVNVAPITQVNLGFNFGALFDNDLGIDVG
ncbi:hypothetical protein [Salinarimonas sp.]|uniref:hypothetical protein n=1 Tax=Salinarimonas sp. TaxID=2766526 RepID=UPI00391CBE9F